MMAKFLSVENLEQVYQENPNSLIFAYLASRYVEQGEYTRAVELCEKGLEVFPEYAFGHYIYGLAHYYLKNFTRAKSELEIALAYDPMSPQAWKILADIHEKLNLAALTQENYLYYYLVDPFSSEAAEKFYSLDVAQMLGGMGEILTEESESEAVMEESVSEKNPFEDLFGSEDRGNDELDLDEVLRETLSDLKSKPQEEEGKEKEVSEPVTEEPFSSDEPSPEEAELTREMDELFREFEEGVKEETPPGAEEKKETVEEVLSPEEETEFPEDFVEEGEEEPIDFSAVVADLISEGEETEDKKKDKEEKLEPPQNSGGGEVVTEEELFTVPEEKEPEKPSEEEKVETAEKEEEPASATPEVQKEKTTHIGKPPLLSPTLGEIYIAQGRFEEAIEVFRQLLEKEPDNSRYKRKIEDLQQIIEKKNSLDLHD